MKKTWGVRVYKEAFNFCSAHFLIFADGTREELHGHNYRVRVEVDGPLGDGDMVLDFMYLKPLVKRVCDSIDHRLILPRDNPFLELREEAGQVLAIHGEDHFSFPKRDVIVLPIRNTSTERLAEWACARIRDELQRTVPAEKLDRIRVSVEESSGQCGSYEERALA